MDRRELLLAGGTALASSLVARTALAQAAGAPSAASSAAAPAPVKKLQIDTYSRHLQWLRTPEEVAKAVIEMGYDGIDITVRPYPGHVDPAKVATDLPPFVKVIRDAGIKVSTVTCPITDADSPNAERILDTLAQLDIRHYWWGTFRYEQGKPVMAQLDALKPRVEKLAKLNAKYGVKAMYHNYSGPGTVGSAIWDLLHVLRNFDPRWVSFHFDTGHATNAGGNNTWALNMRAAGPYVGGLSIKDSLFYLDLETPEGGPFTGTPAQLNARPPGAGPGGPGRPPAAPLSTAEQQAINERGVQGPLPGAAPAGPPAAAGPGGAPGGGRGNGGPPGGPPPRGGGGQPNPWRIRQVPLGMGQLNLPLLAEVVKEINFAGPVEIQAEYFNGGAESAQTKLTRPRAMVLGNMKRDLLTLKQAWANTGLV
jgi:sugar phosphate isomerase/epimerase